MQRNKECEKGQDSSALLLGWARFALGYDYETLIARHGEQGLCSRVPLQGMRVREGDPQRDGQKNLHLREDTEKRVLLSSKRRLAPRERTKSAHPKTQT